MFSYSRLARFVSFLAAIVFSLFCGSGLALLLFSTLSCSLEFARPQVFLSSFFGRVLPSCYASIDPHPSFGLLSHPPAVQNAPPPHLIHTYNKHALRRRRLRLVAIAAPTAPTQLLLYHSCSIVSCAGCRCYWYHVTLLPVYITLGLVLSNGWIVEVSEFGVHALGTRSI